MDKKQLLVFMNMSLTSFPFKNNPLNQADGYVLYHKAVIIHGFLVINRKPRDYRVVFGLQ